MARAALFFVPGVTACSEYGVNEGADKGNGPAPDIEVEPPALEFDLLSSGEVDKGKFIVRNVGFETLHVSDVVIGSGLAFAIESDTDFDLAPEEEKEVEVSFTPMGANENYGQALVLSDDPDEPEVPVDLLGFGRVPELQITPESYIFGDTFIPCGSSVELELKNVGSEDLIIDGFEYTSGGMLTFDDNGLEAELPLTLAPDETRTVFVTFSAATVGADTGVLEVTCNDPRGVVTADQNGEGSFLEENTEAFTEPGVPPVDVMLLIDQSCSMDDDNRDDVQNGMPLFINELQNVSDWQLIEITSPDGCANGGIMDASFANPAQLLINNAWNHTYDSAPGLYDPFLSESLLYLAALGLSQTGPGQCNEGFLRPGSLLHIIILSDEPDISPNTPAAYVSNYQSYVSSPDYVKVSGALDQSGCGGGNAGYYSAVTMTGGTLLNICTPDWGSGLSNIASEVLAGIRTYNLSSPAVPETIVVTVNGTPTTDFTYSEANNSVTIESPPVGEGDLVEVTYVVAAECN